MDLVMSLHIIAADTDSVCVVDESGSVLHRASFEKSIGSIHIIQDRVIILYKSDPFLVECSLSLDDARTHSLPSAAWSLSASTDTEIVAIGMHDGFLLLISNP